MASLCTLTPSLRANSANRCATGPALSSPPGVAEQTGAGSIGFAGRPEAGAAATIRPRARPRRGVDS